MSLFGLTTKCLALTAALGGTAAFAQTAEPTGEWLVEKGVARVKIDNCGGSLWGVVSWEQTPGRDENNPDPSRRDRPTLGMPVLLDMKPANGKWEGEVYNAENGKRYSSSIRLASADTLRIQGCVLGFLCGGENWTRFAGAGEPPRARAVDVCSIVGRPAGVGGSRSTGSSHERRLK
jgi:uncharacterized protein (DUF2147 family)